MTATVAKPQGVAARRSRKKRLANSRPQEHELAVRPGAGGKLALNSEAQQSVKTHQVEPGGTRGEILHLTWGDLSRESAGEVSRGRSSEEAA